MAEADLPVNPPLADDHVQQAPGWDPLLKRLRRQARKFVSVLSKVLAVEEPEAVHDLRVCTRRLQQGLEPLGLALGRSKTGGLRRSLKKARRSVGEWRNADVALQNLTSLQGRKSAHAQDWEVVAAWVAGLRHRELERARGKLLSARFFNLPKQIEQLGPGLARDHAGLDAGVATWGALAKRYALWKDALATAEAQPSTENIHNLRKKMKGLRYAIELARDLKTPAAPEQLKWLKSLQDKLGRWHNHRGMCRYIAQALRQGDLMLEQPRMASRLLFAVERYNRTDGRQLEAFLAECADSPGRVELDRWIDQHCQPRGSAAPSAA